MASTPASKPTVYSGNRSVVHKTVALRDWWLIKVPNDGGGGVKLGVAGVDCSASACAVQLQPRRLFSSAPIAKRFDVFSVETEDGIWVLINGYLNKQRTTENGFSSEVVRSFQFGFPPNWEECVTKFLGGDSARTSDVSESIPDSNELASADRVSRRKSRFSSCKRKAKRSVGSGLNSKRSTGDSDPAVFRTLRNSVQNNNCKGGRSMSHPSDSELQEEINVNVTKKLDFGCVEDDLQPDYNEKQGQRGENITAQDGGKDNVAKEQNTLRKGSKRVPTFDGEEIPTPEVNKNVSIVSPDSLNFKRSRTGRLLLPPLQFWKNQMAVYDKDLTIIGLQQGRVEASPIGGRTGSESSKRRR